MTDLIMWAAKIAQPMTDPKRAASRRNGRLGGRPKGTIKPLPPCLCERTDGKHTRGCKYADTLRKRALRARHTDNVADAIEQMAREESK